MVKKYSQEEIEEVVTQALSLLKQGAALRPTLENIDTTMKLGSRELYVRKDFECMLVYRRHHWHKRTENSLRFLSFVDQVRLRNEELTVLLGTPNV